MKKSIVNKLLIKSGLYLTSDENHVSKPNIPKQVKQHINKDIGCYEYHEYCLKDSYIVYDRIKKRNGRSYLLEDFPIKMLLLYENDKLTYIAIILSRYIRYIVCELFLLLLPLGLWLLDYTYSQNRVFDQKQIIGYLVFCVICWSVAIWIYLHPIRSIIKDIKNIFLIVKELQIFY